MGQYAVSRDPLSEGLKRSQGIQQPIIIYTTAGQDPTSSLSAWEVALTPGREGEADERIREGLDSFGRALERTPDTPCVMVLKGAHLCPSWLERLPSQLAELATAYGNKYGAGFSEKIRIVLLLEPRAEFPAGLSRISWRICL